MSILIIAYLSSIAKLFSQDDQTRATIRPKSGHGQTWVKTWPDLDLSGRCTNMDQNNVNKTCDVKKQMIIFN